MIRAIQKISLSCLCALATSGATAQAPLNFSEPAIVKILTDSTDQACVGAGTGFFVTADGLVITAAHVVPDKATCPDLHVRGHIERDTVTFDLVEDQRSALDVITLRPKVARNTPYLAVVREIANPLIYRNQPVVVTLMYRDYVSPSFTEAKIAAVEFVGMTSSFQWELSTLAANKGRSGSPVLTSDGAVVAVFVSKPIDDPSSPDENRARVVPIAFLRDINLPPASGPAPLSVSGPQPDSLRYAFPFEIDSAPEAAGDAYYFKDKSIVKGPEDPFKALMFTVAGGYELVRGKHLVTQEFVAKEGYIFGSGAVEIRPSSLNPRITPLPGKPCTSPIDSPCWLLSPDKTRLTVRFEVYSGRFDFARGWIAGEVIASLVKPTN